MMIISKKCCLIMRVEVSNDLRKEKIIRSDET